MELTDWNWVPLMTGKPDSCENYEICKILAENFFYCKIIADNFSLVRFLAYFGDFALLPTDTAFFAIILQNY